MTQSQWTLLTISGIIFVVSVNVWAAKRDAKLLETYTESSVIYKQLPVIPYSESQWTQLFVTGTMIINSANMQGFQHTNKH